MPGPDVLGYPLIDIEMEQGKKEEEWCLYL
jgi:hypothetical protein